MIYLMRHQERSNNPLFFSPLTENGLQLANELTLPDFDEIYCSPFLRCVQTILPTSVKQNKKIKIDNRLYERMEDPIFTSENSSFTWEDLAIEYHTVIDTNYKTIPPPSIGETLDQVFARVQPFISSLDATRDILLVTHLGVCDAIFGKSTNMKMGELRVV